MDNSTEGAQFLKQKYDLHASPEVGQAALRAYARTDEPIPQDPLARIQNYLSRFSEIADRQDPEKRERGVDALKQILHRDYVIKPEAIPEGYFENQRRLAREQGHGDIEITRQMREQLTEVIVTDQKSSLDNWVDYLASPDATYPMWLKYWATRSIVGMGEYDKEKKAFTKRSTGTTKPFPDLNREALSYVLDAVEKKYKGQKASFAALDEQGQHEWDQLLQRENFSKLYGFAIDKITPASEEMLSATNGQWVRYPQGGDHMDLVASLQGKSTGWCTAGESTAQRQLEAGDFYVFYSSDATGKSSVPRAAIRMEGNHIAEVRGVAAEQNLDGHIAPIVEQKLHEFPDGPAYEKRARDMRVLTLVEQKTQRGQQLDKNDLTFLYEIDGPIDGFGYQKDPRIAELRLGRKAQEDAPIVLECSPQEIAWRKEDVTSATKAYIGPLFPGIFDQLRHTEQIYTSFPEGKIARETLEVGRRSAAELERAMKAQNVQFSSHAQNMLRSSNFATLSAPEAVDIVRLKVGDLGFTKTVTTQQLYACLEEFGLDLVPPEVGPEYRLSHMDLPRSEWVYMGMKPIADSGSPLLFAVAQFEVGPWLRTIWAEPDDRWDADCTFVFRLRKLET